MKQHIAIAALITAAFASGQSVSEAQKPLPELVSDRPDFTESNSVVGTGVVQTEIGMTLDHEAGARHFTTPEVLVRTGISSRVEMRFSSTGLMAERADGTAAPRSGWRAGSTDLELGLKVRLWDQHGQLPALSLIPMIGMPSGSSQFTSGGYEPGVKIALARDLPANFTLGSNINFNSLIGESGRFLQKTYTASLGHGLGRGFGGYWEVYSVGPWDTGRAWIANSGVTHMMGENAQWDFRVGRRLTAEGPDWFVGGGFVFRQRPRFAWR